MTSDVRSTPVVKDGSIPNDPNKTNWVEEAGGLPAYIRKVAEDLHSERGMSVSHAIAAAVNRIKVWSRGGGDTKPETQAQAAAALAQWSAMKTQKALSTGLPVQDADLAESVAKGLNYMEKPHRFTPGPAGACLFCSNTQRWHTENRPKTPGEVEQEKKDRSVQDKNDDAVGSALMLTALPTEDDMLAGQMADQKRQATADKVSGGMLQDPNDPETASGVYKKALALTLAKALIAKGVSVDAPLVEIQYDPEKKAGGINEQERKQLADDGVAMEDGTFPVRDESDLKTALKFWGKASDPHAARDHIIARAYDLDLLDLLPQNLKDYDEQSKSKQPAGEGEQTSSPTDGTDTVKKAAYAITKSTDEKRYTLGPMYIPDRLDAHNEFTTADELQKAVWDYVRSGDRQIRLQHNLDIVAGECVEVLSWPSEITASMALPSATLAKSASVTFPAGTTYMGIVWEPWAWEWVKKGKISGLSMGGFAKRVAVEFDDPSVAKALTEGALDQAISKYAASQPRDEYGRFIDVPGAGNWFDRNIMGTQTVMRTPKEPSITRRGSKVDPANLNGLINPARTSPFRLTSRENNKNGVSITHLSYEPSLSKTPESVGRAEASAIALAVSTMAAQAGISMDRLLEILLDKMKVSKHGQKGTPGYPHTNGPGRGNRRATVSSSSSDVLDNLRVHPDKISGLHPDDPRLAHPAYHAKTEALNESIHKALTEKGDSKTQNLTPEGDYTEERSALHKKIIDSLMAKYADTPRDHKAIIMAGASGAGKSSILKEKFNVDPDKTDKFAVINADDIKDLLIAEKAIPASYVDYGLNDGETAALIHEESSDVSKILQALLLEQGTNVVLDGTLSANKSEKDVAKVKQFTDAGYKIQGVLVDGHIEHSLSNAAARHSQDTSLDEAPQGGYQGRYVPFEYILTQAPSGVKSKIFPKRDRQRTKNAENFEAVVDSGLFDSWEIYNGYRGDDGNGAEGKTLTASGSKSKITTTRGN